MEQTWAAVKQAKDYPNLFRYLGAWFCFSDGLNTMSLAAVIFATGELAFSSTEAALMILIALFMGSWGGIFFIWLQRILQWSAKKMLMLHIVMFMAMCFYAMFGLIDGCPFGLKSKGEMYVYVVVYGLNWGSMQSYARAVFAYLVPVGQESQMFALYEITDKGSSWIGPLMVGLITNVADIRWGMFYVTVFFAVALPVLIWGVDLRTGMIQAGRWDNLDPDDPNLKGLDQDNNNNNNTTNGNNDKGNKKETEMADTNNYDDPKVKIKVTSIDDEEEEERKKKDMDSKETPNSRTNLINENNQNGQNNNNGQTNYNEDKQDNNNGKEDEYDNVQNNIAVDSGPINEVASSSDNDEELDDQTDIQV